jgi:cytochrome c oxidase subunit III
VLGLFVMFVVCAISILLRCREFKDVHFRWDDNAYGSVVWAILVMHLIYLISAAGEFVLMFAWAIVHPFEDKHGLDVTLMGGFWYWVVGIWAISYVIVFWYPRWS